MRVCWQYVVVHKTIDGAYPQVGFHITTCFSGDCEFGDAIPSARELILEFRLAHDYI